MPLNLRERQCFGSRLGSPGCKLKVNQKESTACLTAIFIQVLNLLCLNLKRRGSSSVLEEGLPLKVPILGSSVTSMNENEDEYEFCPQEV